MPQTTTTIVSKVDCNNNPYGLSLIRDETEVLSCNSGECQPTDLSRPEYWIHQASKHFTKSMLQCTMSPRCRCIFDSLPSLKNHIWTQHLAQVDELDPNQNYPELYESLKDCEECEFSPDDILGMEAELCIVEHHYWEVFTCNFMSGCSVLMDDKTSLVNHILKEHFKVPLEWEPPYYNFQNTASEYLYSKANFRWETSNRENSVTQLLNNLLSLPKSEKERQLAPEIAADEEANYDSLKLEDIWSVARDLSERLLQRLNPDTGESGFFCCFCPHFSVHRNGVARHIEATHVNRTTVGCDYCQVCFETEERLTEHMIDEHEVRFAPSGPRGRYECCDCAFDSGLIDILKHKCNQRSTIDVQAEIKEHELFRGITLEQEKQTPSPHSKRKIATGSHPGKPKKARLPQALDNDVQPFPLGLSRSNADKQFFGRIEDFDNPVKWEADFIKPRDPDDSSKLPENNMVLIDLSENVIMSKLSKTADEKSDQGIDEADFEFAEDIENFVTKTDGDCNLVQQDGKIPLIY